MKKREREIEVNGVRYLLRFWEYHEPLLKYPLPYVSISRYYKDKFLWWEFEGWDEIESFWTEHDRVEMALNKILEWHSREAAVAAELEKVRRFCEGG